MHVLTSEQLHSNAASIRTILTAFGVQLWTPEAVAAHKQKELLAAPPKSKLWFLRHFYSDERYLPISFALWAASMFSGFITGVTFLSYGFSNVFGYSPYVWVLPVGVASAAVFAVVRIVATCFERIMLRVNRTTVRGPAYWVKMRWEQCSVAEFPPLAVSLVATAREYSPQVPVFVHLLMQDNKVLDPILQIGDTFPLVWGHDGSIISPPA